MHLILLYLSLFALFSCGGSASHGSIAVDTQTASGQTAEDSEPQGGVIEASSEAHSATLMAGTPTYLEASSGTHSMKATSATISVVSESPQHSVNNFVTK
jgi:hypothetical protein